MSAPPGPPPYGGHEPGSASPHKRPPSWWWFLGPVVLVVLSGIVFAAMLLWTVNDVTQVDARVPVDGGAHSVTVPDDGERMLFSATGGARSRCAVTDSEGREIEQRDVFGEVTMTRDGREWSGLTRFDPGDGDVMITCSQGPAGMAEEVLVTPAHDIGGLVLRVVGTIFVPMILGGIGVLWALILGIVILTRRSHD